MQRVATDQVAALMVSRYRQVSRPLQICSCLPLRYGVLILSRWLQMWALRGQIPNDLTPLWPFQTPSKWLASRQAHDSIQVRKVRHCWYLNGKHSLAARKRHKEEIVPSHWYAWNCWWSKTHRGSRDHGEVGSEPWCTLPRAFPT